MANAEELIPIKSKLLRRFYEPLLLLEALDQTRGERSKPENDIEDAGPSHRKIRRSFIDDIAYICAYKKGPDHVTAATLERTPQGTTVWLASNTDIESRVVKFLEGILLELQQIANYNASEASRQATFRIKESILSRITTFLTPKLEVYYERICKRYIPICLDVIGSKCEKTNSSGQEDDLELANLQKWLREHFEDGGGNLQDLVRACHRERYSQRFKSLLQLTGQGQTRSHEFEQLYKLLCKLGKPVSVSRKLIEAATVLLQDFIQGFTVRTIQSSKSQPLPLKGKATQVRDIAHRMFSNPGEESKFMERLRFLCDEEELSNKLQGQRSVKTRVHAELLLVDYFEAHGITFIDGNDRYIGCSKPACYLCHAYISSHPSRYTLPASHKKIYVAWRLPDIALDSPNNGRRSMHREQTLLRMIEQVRKELRDEMESRTTKRPFHADSTAGMTSTIDSHSLDATTLMRYLSLRDMDAPFLETESIDKETNQVSHEASSDDEGGVAL